MSEMDVSEMAFELGLDTHTDLLNQVSLFNQREGSPEWYSESYTLLQEWIDQSSFQSYQNELQQLLWPIFVHMVLELFKNGHPVNAVHFISQHKDRHKAHNNEIEKLQVLMPSQVKSSEIGLYYLETQRKFSIQMSAFSHKLLVHFLEDKRLMLLLRIINEHIHFDITSTKPLSGENYDSKEDGSLSRSESKMQADLVDNKRDIHWGILKEEQDILKAAKTKQEQTFAQQRKEAEDKRAALAREKEDREKEKERKAKQKKQKQLKRLQQH